MILKFKVLSDEVEDFMRDYEVDGSMNLKDFHDFICNDLEYDTANFSSFFVSDDKWGKLQEYTLVDMQDTDDYSVIALPMEDTLLEQVVPGRKDRLIFMFDIFAARSLFLEVVAVGEPDPIARYPRVAASEGIPPHQLNADSLMDEESPYNDVMEEFMDYAGEDDDSVYYDDGF